MVRIEEIVLLLKCISLKFSVVCKNSRKWSGLNSEEQLNIPLGQRPMEKHQHSAGPINQLHHSAMDIEFLVLRPSFKSAGVTSMNQKETVSSRPPYQFLGCRFVAHTHSPWSVKRISSHGASKRHFTVIGQSAKQVNRHKQTYARARETNNETNGQKAWQADASPVTITKTGGGERESFYLYPKHTGRCAANIRPPLSLSLSPAGLFGL